jgi:uncharacterized surface protein with fasciclin (FAS1) repeats
MDILSEMTDHTAFTAALDLAGVADLLVDPLSDLTVFAPSDSAFASFDQEYLTMLMSWKWVAHLANLLSLHITDGEVGSPDLTDGLSIFTYSGEFIQIGTNATFISVSSDAGVNGLVVQPDIFTSNGVVHGITGVLTPSFLFKVVSKLSPTYATFMVLLEITDMKTVVAE